jgi:hypothetical protein
LIRKEVERRRGWEINYKLPYVFVL